MARGCSLHPCNVSLAKQWNSDSSVPRGAWTERCPHPAPRLPPLSWQLPQDFSFISSILVKCLNISPAPALPRGPRCPEIQFLRGDLGQPPGAARAAGAAEALPGSRLVRAAHPEVALALPRLPGKGVPKAPAARESCSCSRTRWGKVWQIRLENAGASSKKKFHPASHSVPTIESFAFISS